MKRFTRRTAIAALIAAPVLSIPAIGQAGVIPWLYDSIFGPVYPGYGYGYPSAPYPSACAPCGSPCMTSAPSPCSSGACPTVAFYNGPCGVPSSSCEAKAVWKSDAGTSPLPKKPAADTVSEGPSTFKASPKTPPLEDDISPHDASRPVSPVEPMEPGRPAPPSLGPVGDTAPAGGAAGLTGGAKTVEGTGTSTDATSAVGDDPDFPKPKVGTPETNSPLGTPAPKLNDGELKGLDPVLKQGSQLDNKSTWNVTARLPQRSVRPTSLGSATLVRRIAPVKADYVIPAETPAHIASR